MEWNGPRKNKMPLHIAITRRVRGGCEAEFQQLLRTQTRLLLEMGSSLFHLRFLTDLHGGDVFPRRRVPDLRWLPGEDFVPVRAPGCQR